MQYSIDQMHQPKPANERRNGKTVDALADVIGKVMVTEDAAIPFVMKFLSRKSAKE